MPLTLLIPELLWPEPEDRATQDALACPALATLLARAQFRRAPAVSYEAALCDAAGLPENAPYAALRRLGEADLGQDDLGSTTWLAADPVHLRFLQERLVLADPSQLALDTAEAEAILASFNRELALSAASTWATPAAGTSRRRTRHWPTNTRPRRSRRWPDAASNGCCLRSAKRRPNVACSTRRSCCCTNTR